MIGDIIIANVVFSAFLIILIYIIDINEKEPPWTLVRIYAVSIILTFIYGKMIAALLQPFHGQFSLFFTHFFLAGFLEEFWKLLIVLVFVWPLKSFNDELDGIIYFLIVAAGFTVMENVGYSFKFAINPYLTGLKTGEMGPYHLALRNIVLLRIFSGHIFINVVSGAFVGLAKKQKKIWLLLPGFLISVMLHGFWNQAAVYGILWIYSLLFLGFDVWLFIKLTRRSFYYKFIKRLKARMKELIQQAKSVSFNEDIVLLMQSIQARIGALGRMQSDIMIQQSKMIIETLPVNIAPVSDEREESDLLRRFIKVYGILGRDYHATSGCFWFGLYLKFVLTGFFILTVIMRIMIKG